MHYWYDLHDECKSVSTNTVIVFSAPKYCDSTENKGAYINIGPNYKLEFHKFDAVPHPDIKPMVSSMSLSLSWSLLMSAKAYAQNSSLMGMT